MRHCSRSSLTYFGVGVAAAISCMLYYQHYHHQYQYYYDEGTHTDIETPDALHAHVIPMSKPVVITVGSGLAGLAAAHEALRAGARVHMLDRAPKPGGNSIKASSGINGAGTRFQREKNILGDDSSKFFEDSIRSAGTRLAQADAQGQGQGKGISEGERRELIEILATQSVAAVDWLADEIGVDLTTVAQLGGHSVARTHRGTTGPPPGAAIVGALLKKLGADPGFTLTSSADVQALTVGHDGAVTGVRYTLDGESEPREEQGAVVFATGGFAGDARGLLATHRPDLAGMPSTNDARPASHGLLASLGAVFVDMDSVQIHPTGFVDPKDPTATYKFLAAEALRGEGGILLSAEGRRFVNEMERRDVASEAIMALPRAENKDQDKDKDEDKEVRQWHVSLLLDPGAAEAVGSHLGFYLFKGLMRRVKVKDLPPAVIEAVDRYAAAVAAGVDDEFGRKAFGHWRLPAGEANREEEVAVGTVTPVTHFTMGGVAFNSKAQVLGKKGGGDGDGDGLVPIKGVWAAGEITGGIHGDNRLGGSSLLECAVFGRIAGAEAAKSLVGA
ncbi:FAD binding domain-containing protein [Xylaria cf. heliscus]|nr:FAD binding domain-containing protein [Xylaria cf. heliscus]